MNQDGYKRLISGQRRGVAAFCGRFFLRLISIIYRIAVVFRNRCYRSGRLKTYGVEKPVISIGNLTAGGTGKTPLVIWVCNLLEKRQVSCAILTRGYKSKKGKFSDEPAILSKSCPGAKIIMNPDRVAGAKKAIDEHKTEVLVMDDGFQHRRLERDVDIVTIDAICPFGYNRILPAGLLREPISQIKRADGVVITRCDMVTEEKLGQIEERIRKFNSDIPIGRTIHQPIRAKRMGNKEFDLEGLKGKKVFAFCGIGNPEAFFNTIKSLGMSLVESRSYNDHHNYSAEDIADIYEEARYLEVDLILTTQKDWTKTSLLAEIGNEIPFAWLQIELSFISGEEKITELIEKALACKISETKKED